MTIKAECPDCGGFGGGITDIEPCERCGGYGHARVSTVWYIIHRCSNLIAHLLPSRWIIRLDDWSADRM